MEGLALERTGDVRVSMNDPDARTLVGGAVARALGPHPRAITFLCIGSDRATGDCLGPLVGSLLIGAGVARTYDLARRSLQVDLVGSLESPVHAGNLDQCVAALSFSRGHHRIVAVDAALGRSEHVGTVSVAARPLLPGAGVKKALPPVGHLQVTGTVNVSGFMELAVLQNTRLATVLALAHVIADGLQAAISMIAEPVSGGFTGGSVQAAHPASLRSVPLTGRGRLSREPWCKNA